MSNNERVVCFRFKCAKFLFPRTEVQYAAREWSGRIVKTKGQKEKIISSALLGCSIRFSMTIKVIVPLHVVP